MKNKFEIRGDVTAIFLNSPKYGPMETIIDTADLPIAREFPNTWHPIRDSIIETFYVMGKITLDGKRTGVYLHRWICNPGPELQVDHINHDTLNNRRSINLRLATPALNQQNKKSTYRNSASGIRGVRWCKSMKKWRAVVGLNNKKKHIGYFSDIEDARIAVERARAELMPYSQEAVIAKDNLDPSLVS